MAHENLTLELVTPERVALEGKASFVVLPAWEGEMGILPGHAPALVQLQPGEVRVTEGGVVRRFAVSGGFAEIKNDRIALFAETAENAEQIDAARAEQAAERAKAEITRKDIDPLTLAAAEASLRRAQIRMLVVNKFMRRRSEPPAPHND